MFKTKLALGAVLVGGLCVACGKSERTSPGVAGSGGNTIGAAGQTGIAGAAGQPTAGSSGTDGAGGIAGAAGQSTAGAAGPGVGTAGATDAGDAAAGDAFAATDSGDSGTSDAGGPGDGGGIDRAILRVARTIGCGMDPGQTPGMTVAYTIATSGTKDANCADSVCGPWMYARQYFITLPLGYDKTKAYPLVFQGPGCGATGKNVYPLNSLFNGLPANDNADNTVIRVGLTPPPNTIGNATRPHQGCFDESEGDDSVEWVFYEHLYDRLAEQLCFDRNRVFASGSASGGGKFSDQLACKYAGDATRPIRGVMSNAGDWSMDPRFTPTCTTKPTAGMWIHSIGDQFNMFARSKVAIARAMMVDGCTIGTGFDDAQFDPFPVGVGPISSEPWFNLESACKRIRGCPDVTPLVVCALPDQQQGDNVGLANPGFSTFLKLFENPPLLSP